jgi:sugar lactone lactonase YvrE
LAVAQPAVAAGLVAKILLVHPDGTTGELLDASQMPADLPPLVVPNGVYADFDGSVWVTEFATSHVFRIGPDRKITSIVTGDPAATANGIVFDRSRGLLFYTNTSTGTLRRVAIANGPPFTPEIVTTIAQAALDGLTLDSCGNAYAIGSQKLWRFSLDSRGVSSGPPTVLATFDESVASAQFGRGSGFDARSLYVSSIVGKVYRVDVGIRGAAVPLPP